MDSFLIEKNVVLRILLGAKSVLDIFSAKMVGVILFPTYIFALKIVLFWLKSVQRKYKSDLW